MRQTFTGFRSGWDSITVGLLLSILVVLFVHEGAEANSVALERMWPRAILLVDVILSGTVCAVAWALYGVRRQTYFALLAGGFLGVALSGLAQMVLEIPAVAAVAPHRLAISEGWALAARGLSALTLLLVTAMLWRESTKRPLRSFTQWRRCTALAGVLVVAVSTALWYGWAQTATWVGGGVLALHLCAILLQLLARATVPFYEGPKLLPVLVAAAVGEAFSLRVSSTGFFDLAGAAYTAVAWLLLLRAMVGHVVTAHVNAEDTLRTLKIAVEQSPNTVMITDLNSRLRYANQAFVESTGYSLQEALGQTPAILHSGKNPKHVYDDMWRKLSRGEMWRGELMNQRKDGSHYLESVQISPVKDEAGNVTSYLAIKDDITQQRLDKQTITQLANFDALTGLPNRNFFATRLAQVLADSRARGEQVALLYVGLDHFQRVNDSLGHEVGDQVLAEIARRLQKTTGNAELVSRHSGDEFIIAVPNSGIKNAARTAEAIQDAVRQPLRVGSYRMVLTASVGIAISPQNGNSLEALLQCASTAELQAKSEERDSYRFFSIDMQRRSARLLQLGSALRAAIARNELRIVYQPQLDIATQRVVGMEALVRWDHPELGPISPVEFIPVAEANGQIVEIGDWILRTAVHRACQWREQGWPDLVFAVNLSQQQFRNESLLPDLAHILRETGFPPRNLELEFTESIALDDPERAVRVLRSLRERGVLLSIDDFGTGYSSLNHLKRLRPHKLKIDKSFVDDIVSDAADISIVTAIIGMARGLGMTTIAEGVEYVEQLQILEQLGCDEVQGYLFSKPLSATEMEIFLRARRRVEVEGLPSCASA